MCARTCVCVFGWFRPRGCYFPCKASLDPRIPNERTVPEECPELGWGNCGLTLPVRFEVAVDRGWLISLPLCWSLGAERAEGGSRAGQSGVALGSWGCRHSWELSPAASKASRVGGARVHGHVVVLGIGAV